MALYRHRNYFFRTYRATLHACRLVWPPWTSFPLPAHRANVCDLCGQGFCTPRPAQPSISLSCECEYLPLVGYFVMWARVITGVSLETFKRKTLRSCTEGVLRPSITITLVLKQTPSHSNTACLNPVFLSPNVYFSPSTLLRWYHQLGQRKRFSFHPVLYHRIIRNAVAFTNRRR